jgi:glycosyltransferase involved in cell wall biosynthesis
MKICMLAPALLPIRGGVANYIIELLQHLPEKIEVHVLTPKRIDYGNNGLSTAKYEFSKYFRKNVQIHFLSKASDTFYYNAKFQGACLRYIPKLVKEEGIDLIHSHTAHMPDLLLMFKKIKKPIVTTVHSTIRSQFSGIIASGRLNNLERSEKATFFLYPLLRCAEDLYFKQKRVIITPSNWMREQLEKKYHYTNIRVIPNSIDIRKIESLKKFNKTEKLFPSNIKEKKIILFVGRLLTLKGVDVLLEAVPIINEKTNYEFAFIFAGPSNVRFSQKIKKLKVESNCILLGSLPHDQVIRLIKSAELMVLPSFTENAPYVLLESMACGVPVVSTNIGGIPEIIQDGYNGILIKPGNPKTLASSITNLLEDLQLQKSIVQNAKETIRKKFVWSVNLNKILKTYTEVLSTKSYP